MSMDRCAKCGTLIDTDETPESYREEYDDKCVCDSCFDSLEDQLDELEA